MVLNSSDHDVIRIGLRSISDLQLLLKIADRAEDRSARHAAALLAGRSNWEELFHNAVLREAPPGALLAVLSARELFPPQPGTSELLRDALRSLIRRPDEATVAMLEEIIDSYGTASIAEEFYNRGHPDLKRSASLWAHNHGYRFQSMIGYPEVTW